MKESYYNIYVENKKGVICYNTKADIYMFISKVNYQLLKNNLSAFSEYSPTLYQTMVENQYIIPDDTDEFQELKNEYENEIEASPIYDLTILPSLDCNLRCWYCFEKHIHGSQMSPIVSKNIYKHVQYIFDKKRDLTHLSVELFGGEPLLYFKEELYPLLRKIKSYVEDLGKTVSFLFVTNAVCITDELIPLLSSLNARFQISIDGYKDKHDKIKFIPKTRQGTYNQVMRTIHLLTEQRENIYITLRINYDDDTLLHMEELIRDIININRNKLGIHLERVWQTGDVASSNNKKLRDIINLFIINGFHVSYMNLHRRKFSCKVSKERQLTISYDGTVYKCTGRDFTPLHADGTLQNDGSILWEQDKLEKRMAINTFENPMCRRCKFLPLCWGPCNQKQLEADNNNLSRYCQLNLMELNLNDFITYKFNNIYQRSQVNHEK